MEQRSSESLHPDLTPAQGVRADALQQPRKRVAVLGPKRGEYGRPKREQIRSDLSYAGYETFFPGEDDDALKDDFDALRPANVLPILLITEQSAIDGLDLTRFLDDPDMLGKLAILFPWESYDPVESVVSQIAGDVQRMFFYTRDHMAKCRVVRECHRFAQEWFSEFLIEELLPDELLWDSDYGRT